MSLPLFDRKLSYSDYLFLDEEERIEIIDGNPYNMSPAPSTKHQQVSMNLSFQLMNFFKGKGCQVFAAPFDVRLFSEGKKDDEVFNVVQPDLSVICDPSLLDQRGCKGSPDLIIEILSPSSVKLDKMVKRNLYEQAKVKEYWIVDIVHNHIEVYYLDNKNQYGKPVLFTMEDEIKSLYFDGLGIKVNEIF